MKNKRDEHTFKDPVCGMEISRTGAADETVHHGKTYYFCSRSCRIAFEEAPKKYIRSHRQHGMKPKAQ